MPKAYPKKPLGAWPNDQKHKQAKSLEDEGTETVMGTAPVSGSDEVADVEEIAKSMGIYEGTEPKADDLESGPENPAEVNIAREIEKNREG